MSTGSGTSNNFRTLAILDQSFPVSLAKALMLSSSRLFIRRRWRSALAIGRGLVLVPGSLVDRALRKLLRPGGSLEGLVPVYPPGERLRLDGQGTKIPKAKPPGGFPTRHLRKDVRLCVPAFAKRYGVARRSAGGFVPLW